MSEQRHASLQLHHTPGQSGGGHPGVRRRRLVRRAQMAALLVLVLLGVGAARTLLMRRDQADLLAATADQQARVHVAITHARPGKAGQGLVLPGSLQGMVEAPIYARATGYLLHWYKDIGAMVDKGELLAELDTPEIDQQLSQAIAARAQAQASLGLARSSAQRWQALRHKDAVSQQELDERRSALEQAEANLQAAEANVRRLREQQSFKRIVAPFAGKITRRNVDVGDLIDAGSGSARAMFSLARIDRLKTYVNVPQSYAQGVETGQAVKIRQAELPGQVFEGTITRSAGAIDASTRTMQIVVELPNPGLKLLPGAYVDVELPQTSAPRLVLPAETLMFRGDGPHVAVVADGNRAKLQPVSLGRNFGRTIEILSGVTPTDPVIANPPDSLADGDPVDVVAPQARAPQAPASQAQAPQAAHAKE